MNITTKRIIMVCIVFSVLLTSLFCLAEYMSKNSKQLNDSDIYHTYYILGYMDAVRRPMMSDVSMEVYTNIDLIRKKYILNKMTNVYKWSGTYKSNMDFVMKGGKQ